MAKSYRIVRHTDDFHTGIAHHHYRIHPVEYDPQTGVILAIGDPHTTIVASNVDELVEKLNCLHEAIMHPIIDYVEFRDRENETRLLPRVDEPYKRGHKAPYFG